MTDLSSYSLKDLLKLVRSHDLELPAHLPTDKQVYIDMILEHRARERALAEEQQHSMEEAAAAEAEGEVEGSFVQVESRKRILAEQRASQQQEGKEGVEQQSLADVDYEEAEEEFSRTPIVQKITSILQNIAVFDYLERHTSVPRFYWFVLVILALSAFILAYIGIIAVCNFICFLYPAYQTYKTLEGKFLPGVGFDAIEENRSIEVHRYWLTYWVVYGIFRLVEFVADYTLFWMPYYEPLKIAFLVWCFHPASQGCATVYRIAIRTQFLMREQQIDAFIDRFVGSMSQAFTEVKGLMLKKVANKIAGSDVDTPQKRRAPSASYDAKNLQ